MIFLRFTPTPKGQMAAEGCPTLALFYLKIIEINENHSKVNLNQ